MTRDEAVKKAEGCFQFNRPSQEWFFTPLRLVAALENIGLLKFEEPNGLEKLKAVMEPMGYAAPCVAFRDIEEALNLGGLKIVEKQP